MPCLGDPEESSLVERKRNGMVVVEEVGGLQADTVYFDFFVFFLQGGPGQ